MAYGKVHETFWDDPKIRALPESARVLMLYLITCRHKNRLGCYVLDPHYAAADLQWPQAKVTEGLAQLTAAGRIEYDAANRVVLVKRFLVHNALENSNVVLGAVSELRSLPDTPLLEPLMQLLEKNSRSHYYKLTDALRNRLANRSANHMPNTPAHVSLGLNQNLDLNPPLDPPPSPEPADEPPEPKGGKRKRKQKLPDDWQPNAKHVEIAKREGADINDELENFRDHAASTGRVLLDWDAAFRMWLRLAKDFRRGTQKSPPASEAARVREELPGRDRHGSAPMLQLMSNETDEQRKQRDQREAAATWQTANPKEWEAIKARVLADMETDQNVQGMSGRLLQGEIDRRLANAVQKQIARGSVA